MSKGLNSCNFIGTLGRDPELKYSGAGVAICTFSIAVNKSWKDADGNKQEKCEWINIVAFRKLAEICGEWLKKGQMVHIAGEMQTDTVEKDGAKKYFTKIVASDMIMLGSSGGGVKVEEREPMEPKVGENSMDLPF